MDGEEAGSSNTPDKNKIVKKTSKKIAHKLTTTIVRYVIPRPIKFWRKFTGNRKQKRISKRIDEDLKKDDHTFYEILVLGDQASGKTTICKQMKILYGNGFSEAERRKFIKIIEKNMKDGVLSVINKVSSIEKSQYIDSEVKEKINFVEKYNSKCDNNHKFCCCIEYLWNTSFVQAAVKSTNETHLITTTKYFVKMIDLLKNRDYIPTNEDVLHCYEPTKDPVEIKFKSDFFYHKMFEIPNLKYGKRLWKQIVNGISTILFVIPCNLFLEVKNQKMNTLLCTIEELKNFYKNAWVPSHLRYIIFLNKVDLFCEKILNGTVNLEERFLGFSLDKSLDVTEDNIVEKAKAYVLSTFTNAIIANGNRWYCWYIHFTCAVNSENMNNVYKECENVIRESYICKFQLY